MRIACITFILNIIFIVSTPAATGAKTEDQKFRSFLSSTSCDQFIDGIQNKETQKEFVIMVGSFITAANYIKDRDSQLDLNGMMFLMEQFCWQNLKVPVTTALIALDKEMDRRIEARTPGEAPPREQPC